MAALCFLAVYQRKSSTARLTTARTEITIPAMAPPLSEEDEDAEEVEEVVELVGALEGFMDGITVGTAGCAPFLVGEGVVLDFVGRLVGTGDGRDVGLYTSATIHQQSFRQVVMISQ
jgi:hypothetical protein